MFKRFSFKKKARPDLRFVDPEEYRSLREPVKHNILPSSRKPKSSIKFGDSSVREYSDLTTPLSSSASRKESFYRDLSGAPLYVNHELDETIQVKSETDLSSSFIEKRLNDNETNQAKADLFDLFISEIGETTNTQLSDEKNKAKLEEHLAAKASLTNQTQFSSSFIGPNYLCKNSLGIFSDSKVYSALIKNELSAYRLDVRHFNHPNTFVESRFDFFDRVSAWIIFLSDDGDEQFIDRFLDRYCDKPTLFLCPKASRTRTAARINQFIDTCCLEEEAIEEDSIEIS